MRGLLNSCLATTRGALIATCLLAASPAAAQIVPDVTGCRRSPIARAGRLRPSHAIDRKPAPFGVGEVFTRVAKDPTTYALPPIIYTAHRLDWDSSQKLFAHGYVEANPDFTVTGRVNDVPISYAAGKRRILRYSAAMIGRSAAEQRHLRARRATPDRTVAAAPDVDPHARLDRARGHHHLLGVPHDPQPVRTVAEERAHAGRSADHPCAASAPPSRDGGRLAPQARTPLAVQRPAGRLCESMDSALPVFVPPLAAAIAAVIAAGLAWALATPLVRAAEGPTLPERLLQWAGQHRFVALLAYLPAAFSGRHAVWALPVAWLGLQITTHRVRRRVFGDTWSFAGQVWWNARAFLAMWAWWWTLMIFPALLVDTGAGPVVTLALGVVLLVWLYFYNDVLGAILGATPIARRRCSKRSNRSWRRRGSAGHGWYMRDHAAAF